MARLRRAHDDPLLPALAIALLLTALLAPTGVRVDGWLGVVLGRELADGDLDALGRTAFAVEPRHGVQSLTGALIAGTYELLGSTGLLVLTAVLRAVVLGWLVVWGWRRGWGAGPLAGAALAGGVVLLPLVPLRAQLLASVLAVALLAVLARAPRERAPWAAVPVLLVWALAHQSVLVGIALASSWAVWHGVSGRALLAFGAAATATAGLISLQGPLASLDALRAMDRAGVAEFATEWEPLSPLSGRGVLVLGLVGGALWWLRRVRAGTWWPLAAAALLAASLVSARFALFALLVAFAGLAQHPPAGRRRLGGRPAVVAWSLAITLAVLLVATGGTTDDDPTGDDVAAAARALPSDGRVLASIVLTDRLLVEDDDLRGRLVADVQYETFRREDLARLERVLDAEGDWPCDVSRLADTLVLADDDLRDAVEADPRRFPPVLRRERVLVARVAANAC